MLLSTDLGTRLVIILHLLVILRGCCMFDIVVAVSQDFKAVVILWFETVEDHLG